MERIEFPITGNLRPGDVLRTVYLEKDFCNVRDTKSAEGRNLFEMALDDYAPGCTQEVWNIEGPGAFVHRDWKDALSLPNLLITQDSQAPRRFFLSKQDGSRVDELDDGRQFEIFDKILRSAQYIPMSAKDYGVWVENYRIWHRRQSN